MRKMRNYEAFTLTEVIIIIAIIGIMTTATIVSLTPARTQSRLKAAQTEVVATIKQAQSYALQGKTVTSGTLSGKTPPRYGFKFTDDQSYQIFYCSTCNGNDDESIESFSLADKGVKLSSPGSENTRFDFDVPHGNKLPASSLTLQLSFAGETKTIAVSEAGAVTESN